MKITTSDKSNFDAKIRFALFASLRTFRFSSMTSSSVVEVPKVLVYNVAEVVLLRLASYRVE